ncbi:MAG: endoglucanase [Robiginitomaculum sp.]|nr:MAG: endoglucanase [Robiginitomaculum sp.]
MICAATVLACAPNSHSSSQKTSPEPIPAVTEGTPVAIHGDLSVQGGKIVGKDGQPVSLAGPSLFWSTTGWTMDRFYNADVVNYFAQDWNAGIIRAAIAAQGNGSYITDPKGNTQKAVRVVDAAIANGIYVIVDWHSHRAEARVEEAKAFFTDMATRYHDTPNIIYELYNEPLNTTDWASTVKPYAEQIIAVIREIDPDNLIIVGTQTWSQDVDKAVANPITGYKNIAYALHFYAATHKDELREKTQKAIDAGLPIMVTEWGSVFANGDGDIDKKSTEAWLALIRENKLSHMMWAVSDKDEGSAMLMPGAPSNGAWTDEHLSVSGKYARKVVREWNAD